MSVESMDDTYANTRVFWNFSDFPVPPGGYLLTFKRNVEKALRREFYGGNVSINAYGDFQSDEEEGSFECGEIKVVHQTDDQLWLHSSILLDMVNWALHNPPSTNDSGPQTNLMVIAKDIPEEDSVFLRTLKRFVSKNYNILLVVPDDEELDPTSCSAKTQELLSLPPVRVWHWGKLFVGAGASPVEWPKKRQLTSFQVSQN